jgi:uncharacterized protein YbjT (DUF2867 family)
MAPKHVNMDLMKAIVVGATGLVGELIVKKLITHPSVSEILVFSRRELPFNDQRLKVHLVDFDKISDWKMLIKGDILFSALGTTLKAAGNKQAQYKVDYEYQLDIATAGSLNDVKNFVLISSVNADPCSSFFYLRMKGELEQRVGSLPFKSLSILRPGPLVGPRHKNRLGEEISISCLKLIPEFLLTPGMRPILANKVATTAVRVGIENLEGIRIVGAREIHL